MIRLKEIVKLNNYKVFFKAIKNEPPDIILLNSYNKLRGKPPVDSASSFLLKFRDYNLSLINKIRERIFVRSNFNRLPDKIVFIIVIDLQEREELLEKIINSINKIFFLKTRFIILTDSVQYPDVQKKHIIEFQERSLFSTIDLFNQKWQYCVVLDRPALFEKNFLIKINSQICERKLNFFYTDNRELDNNNNVSSQCKPVFNYDYFYSFNFIQSPIIIHREIFHRVARTELISNINIGFSTVLAGLTNNNIPERCQELMLLSFKETLEIKKAKTRDRKQLVQKYLQISHQNAEVNMISAELLDLSWPLVNESSVSIIIPFKDQLVLTLQCIDSIIHKTRYRNYEIILVSNNSDSNETLNPLCEKIKENENIRILEYNKEFNYSAINNYAASQSNSDYLLFLNNDTEVISENWLSEMLSLIQRTEIAVVGALLLYPDDTVQHAGVITGLGHVAGHSHRGIHKDSPGYMNRLRCVQEYSAVTGACLLTKRHVFESLGGFDQENLPVSNNDVDYCLRVRETGSKIVWTPKSVLFHYESKSRKDDLSETEQERFKNELNYMKKRHNLNDDPFFNDNFAAHSERFEL